MNFKRYYVSRNLYNRQYMFAYIDSTGKIIENAANVLAYAEVEPNTTYTVSADLIATNGNRIAVFDAMPTANLTGSNVISISQRAYQFTITTNSDTKYIAWHTNFSDTNRLSQFLQTSMLNTGSEPLPYEPYSSEVWHDTPHYIHKTDTDTITTPAVVYANSTTATVGLKGNMYQASGVSPTNPIQPQECGDLETTGTHAGQYKIPISSASTTAPVYLGEVQTTRRIYKLVLTGQESWNVNSTGNSQFFFTTVSNETILNSKIICTHFENANIGQTTMVVGISFAGTVQLRVRPENTSAETVISFKQWLIDQYAAGTPVTVWYVLATPTTGIVNEPLRKIGNYADEVSGISIPVTAGANTISVDTTLQPSEVTVNYKGWHPVADVHERENGAWT